MSGRWLDRDDPWFSRFVASVVVLFASLIVLVFTVFGSSEDSRTAEDGATVHARAPGSAAKPAVSARTAVTFQGELPAAAAGPGLVPAAVGTPGDISFGPDGPGGVVVRSFALVAALGTGVDSLTLAQGLSLLTGEVANWQAVGGLPGTVVRAAVVPPSESQTAASQRRWLGPLGGAIQIFPSYEALRAAMVFNSGIVALVPVSEVRFAQPSIAVDGADPVRGRGELAAWPFAERVVVTANTPRGEAGVAAIRAAVAESLPTPVTVIATGDILQSRCSLARIRDTGDWGAALRGPVADYLSGADLTMASLDGSMQDIGAPYGCVQTTNLTSPPEVMEALSIAGIDEVTVATNHVFDCGQTYCGNRAFLRTLELLSLANIKVTGGGRNLEEALAPAIFEVGGIRIGVLGFDDIAAEDFEATADQPGTAPLDDSYDDERALVPRSPAFYQPAAMLNLSRFTGRIRQLKSEVDVVVVQVQSGTEDTHSPSPRSVKALRAAADAGADVVVGNQAHWVQAVEVRGSSFIAYALGNFVFDQTHTPEHTQGYLLETTFHGKTLVAVRLVPYQIADKYRPVFVVGDTRLKVLGDVFRASAALPLP